MTEVSSFWHGAALSNLEIFCISSFLRNAVKYSLYAYEAPANLPSGAVLKDANEILPHSLLFTSAIVACQKQGLVSNGAQAFPVPWWEYERLFFDPHVSIDDCAAVHFWNAMISAGNIDKNAEYPQESAFERLKRKYL